MSIQIDGTSGISGVDGSATTPALQGTDTNTGLSFGTDEVNIVTGGSTRATVDSSGRLLVGKSSSVGASPRNVQSLNGFAVTTGNDEVAGEVQVFSSSTNSLWIQADPDNLRSSSSMNFSVDGTEQMRIDSAGRLMLGTTTEGHPNADDLTIAGSGHAGITIRSGTTSTGGIFFSDATTGSGEYDGAIEYNQNTQEMALYSAADARMRITANGSVLVDCSGLPGGSTQGFGFYPDTNVVQLLSSSGSTSATAHVEFFNTNGKVGTITTDGTSTSYNTSSDYRLKENVVDLDGAITRVKQLAPKRFNFIADANKTVDGFLAHEAQAVVPEAVFGTHNEVEVWRESEELPEGVSAGDTKLDEDGNPIPKYQGIDQSKLVPLLTAALQEAIGKIEALETRVAQLEGGAS